MGRTSRASGAFDFLMKDSFMSRRGVLQFVLTCCLSWLGGCSRAKPTPETVTKRPSRLKKPTGGK
jgi:hypothetical protein